MQLHLCPQCATPHPSKGRCARCEARRNQEPNRQAHRSKTHRTVTRIVKARDPHLCAQCGATDDLTIDYIVALANGGPQHSTNAQLLCRPCNSSKGAR